MVKRIMIDGKDTLIVSRKSLGKLTTSAVGLRRTAKYMREQGIKGDVELEHSILKLEDGRKLISIEVPKCKKPRKK